MVAGGQTLFLSWSLQTWGWCKLSMAEVVCGETWIEGSGVNALKICLLSNQKGVSSLHVSCRYLCAASQPPRCPCLHSQTDQHHWPTAQGCHSSASASKTTCYLNTDTNIQTLYDCCFQRYVFATPRREKEKREGLYEC